MSASTKIKCVGSFDLFFVGQVLIYLAYLTYSKDCKDVFYISDHSVWHAK